MSFANLKKQSSLGSLTSKLVKEVEKMNSGNNRGDDRLWKPQMDKTGNGYAVIRFLPAPDGEDLPWTKLYTHAFQGPGGWLIDNCPTTKGEKCPVCEYNTQLWNAGGKGSPERDQASKQKRKLSYYSNIYVVQDKANPENEGRVFLYKYGQKIFEKLMSAMQPEFDDQEAINPFDFWQGANFRLKIKKVQGYWNYDSSDFAAPGALLDDDDAMEAIWKQQYSLSEFTSPDQFKDYEQVKKRLDQVLGNARPAARHDDELEDESEGRGSYSPNFSSRRQESELPKELSEQLSNLSSGGDFNSPDIVASNDADEDDALSYFQKLAES